MAELNHNVPLLGQTQPTKGQIGMPVALIRELDENGLFNPEQVIQTPQGPVAVVGRANCVTAQDLVDMIADALIPSIKEIIEDYLVERD